MSKKENWEPCPRCGSNRVIKQGKGYFLLIGVGLIGIGIWLLIIPPIGVPTVIVGLGLMVFGLFTKGFLECRDCKKVWRYKTKTAAE